MKKSLVALATLSIMGGAYAQSSVTLFGVVDAAVERTSTSGVSKTTLVQGANSSSRLGFRGTEDLGGGMSAGFWLEAGMNNDDGTGAGSNANNQAVGAFNAGTGANAGVRPGTQGLTFNRRSTVSLAGGFGELRLGRDYVPAFWNMTVFDPFGTVGVGAFTNVSIAYGGALGAATGVRASNSIGYFLPNNLGGFYGQFMYALGENASNAVNAAGQDTSKDGYHTGLRLGYANGPVNVAFGYGKTKLAAINDYTVTNLGGSYNFGPATLMLQWNQEKSGNSQAIAPSAAFVAAGAVPNTVSKLTNYLVGVSVPLGAGEFKASYVPYKSDNSALKGNQFAVGYVYNLSKRTAVYTTYARLSNTGSSAVISSFGQTSLGASPSFGQSINGFDIGLRHSF